MLVRVPHRPPIAWPPLLSISRRLRRSTRVSRARTPSVVGNQPLHSPADVVADRANLRERATLGIGKTPVFAPETGDERARFAAAHGDEEIRAAREVIAETLRPRVREVEVDLTHHRDDFEMNLLGGLRARGDGTRAGRVGEVVEERRRHLRAAGVVDARKNDARHERHNHGQKSVARPAPASWATTNGVASMARMPENESVSVRATVTAGLAKLVDAVNQ